VILIIMTRSKVGVRLMVELLLLLFSVLVKRSIGCGRGGRRGRTSDKCESWSATTGSRMRTSRHASAHSY